jgi:hypothetical protein
VLVAREQVLMAVQTDIEKLKDSNKKQEERIQSTETKAIQLINLYFVFQGVILTSISSASPVKCHNWWIPFCLSLTGALLNLVSVHGTISNFLKYSEELDKSYEDLQVMMDREMTGAAGNAVVPVNSSSHQENDAQLTSSQSLIEDATRPKPDTYKQRKRYVLCYAGMVLLSGFSCIILYGCRTLLCDTP